MPIGVRELADLHYEEYPADESTSLPASTPSERQAETGMRDDDNYSLDDF